MQTNLLQKIHSYAEHVSFGNENLITLPRRLNQRRRKSSKCNMSKNGILPARLMHDEWRNNSARARPPPSFKDIALSCWNTYLMVEHYSGIRCVWCFKDLSTIIYGGAFRMMVCLVMKIQVKGNWAIAIDFEIFSNREGQ